MTEKGRQWITTAGRRIGVQEGFNGVWITAYQDREEYKSSGGCTGRPRTRFLTVEPAATREEEQQLLDEHAIRLRYTEVTE